MYILNSAYWTALLVVCGCSIFRYKSIDRASRLICLLIWQGLLAEIIAKWVAWRYHNNLFVYTLSYFTEFGLMSLYFNYSIDSFRKNNTGWYIGIGGIAAGILNTVFLQPPRSFCSNFIFLECLGVMLMALYAIYRLLLTDDHNFRLQRSPHFWMACILLFYQCSTLWSWSAFEYCLMNPREKISILYACIFLANILTYCSFGVLFFLYPKMNRNHV